MTQDPIGLAGGVNLYAYAGSNPVSFRDPFGLTACEPPDSLRCRDRIESVGTNDPVFILLSLGTGGLLGGARTTASALGGRAVGIGLLQSAKLMLQTARMLRSSGMKELRAAAAEGVSASVRIGGRTIAYDPLPLSGVTNFAENTFHLGAEAFTSEAELAKTVLHELHRLTVGSAGAVDGAVAATQTDAAFRFAESAYELGRKVGLW